ncbi:hypothetical protein [Arenimonas sp.]|uniref:hypothetical protein n=1 Tax=Arenimonas sp. TaxID=1872635 RepID=UPI0039E259DF
MFDLRRFARLAKAHWAENWKSYASFFGVAIALHFIFVMIALSGKQGFTTFTTAGQAATYFTGLFVLGPIFAARQFGALGRRDSALLMLMRPASTFEKWLLSTMIVIVGFPLVSLLAFYICDIPAWLIAKSQAQVALAELGPNAANQSLTFGLRPENYLLFDPVTTFDSWCEFLTVWLMLLFLQGFGLFGSIYLHRLPLLKTFVAGFVLLLLLILVGTVFDSEPDAFLGYWESRRALGDLPSRLYPILWFVLPALLWFGAYRALKEREIA